MKKVSLMVVAALLSASMFANSASLLKKETTTKGPKQKTEVSKDHKQKDKQKAATPKTKEQKAAQKEPKKAKGTK